MGIELCCRHQLFPVGMLVGSSNRQLCAEECLQHGTEIQHDEQNQHDEQIQCAKQSLYQKERCCANHCVLMFEGSNGCKYMRSLCVPFPVYGIQCAHKQTVQDKYPLLCLMKMDDEKDCEVANFIELSPKDLNMHPRMLSNIQHVTVIPQVICLQAERQQGKMGLLPVIQTSRQDGGTCDRKYKRCRHETYKPVGDESHTSVACSKVMAYVKPLSMCAFQREFPCFTNMCGYMLLKYKPNSLYTESGYMAMHSSDTRLGKGDMVNGDFGKFCVENDASKVANSEYQRITFSAVRDMNDAKSLISQLVLPNLVSKGTQDVFGDIDCGNTGLKPSYSSDEEYMGMIVVHMVVASCRIQHYISFNERNSPLAMNIMCFKLQHIFNVERRVEMDTSMIFLKVKDWQALLGWMESDEMKCLVGTSGTCPLSTLSLHASPHGDSCLLAYREACQAAIDSQKPYMQAWLKYTSMQQNATHVGNNSTLTSLDRDIDANAHMIARITMNGFVQIHLMWNKEKSHKKQKRIQRNLPFHSDASPSVESNLPVPQIGGVFWTPEVEKMVKMRMGLIMYAIEILT
jgi:hypothetical protein